MSGKTVKLSSFAVASDHDDHDCLYKIFDRQKTSIFYSFIFLLSCKDIKIIFSELSRGLANPRSPKNARRGLTNPRYSRRFTKRSRGIAKSPPFMTLPKTLAWIAKSPPFTTFPKRSRGIAKSPAFHDCSDLPIRTRQLVAILWFPKNACRDGSGFFPKKLVLY